MYSEVAIWFNGNERIILFLAVLYGCPLPLNHTNGTTTSLYCENRRTKKLSIIKVRKEVNNATAE